MNTPSPDGPVSSTDIPPARGAPINRRGWWIHLILLTVYFLLIALVGREHHATATHVPALSHTAGGLLAMCAIQLLIFGVVLGLALFASRASRDDLLLRWRPGIWPVPLGIFYSLAIRLAVGLVLIIVVTALEVTQAVSAQSLQRFLSVKGPEMEAVVDISAMRQNPVYFWLTLTLVSFVVAGLREELWRSAFLAGLRTLWPQYFGSRGGQLAAIAIAASLFGFAHLGLGLVTVVIAGLLGFGLGLIMVWHRSIWPAVIAHGMFDATTLALLPWVAEKLPDIQRTLGY